MLHSDFELKIFSEAMLSKSDLETVSDVRRIVKQQQQQKKPLKEITMIQTEVSCHIWFLISESRWLC